MLKLNKIFLILVLSLGLRLFFLSSNPASLNWDEVSMGYTAYSLGQTGRDEWGEKLPLFFRSYGEWKSAGYIYLLVPFVKIFGLNAWSIRLPSALAGVIGVYLIYLLGKKLYREQVGLWAAFLLAVTPWSFMLSRPGFESNLALTLLLAGVYFFLLRDTRYLTLSAIFFGLAPHTYNSAKLVVPFLVLYLLWSSKLYKNIKSSLLILCTLFVFALPILTNLFSGRAQARLAQVGVTTDQKSLSEFYALRDTLPFPTIISKILVNKETYTIYKTTDNWLSYFSPAFLLTHGGDHKQHSLPYHGVLYFTEFILVIFGIYFLSNSKLYPLSSKIYYLPLVLIIFGFLPAAVTRDIGHVLRSLLAIPGFILLAALGANHLMQTHHKLLQLLTWSLGLEIICFLLLYFTWYPLATARDWQYGHKEVASFLKAHESEYDHIIMTKWYGEPQLFLGFYNAWDPTWYQWENQANLRYESEGKMWLDGLSEYTLGKYTFKYLNWNLETRDSKTLYIGKGDDFYADSHILKTIYFPDGTVAFHIVQGDK